MKVQLKLYFNIIFVGLLTYVACYRYRTHVIQVHVHAHVHDTIVVNQRRSDRSCISSDNLIIPCTLSSNNLPAL